MSKGNATAKYLAVILQAMDEYGEAIRGDWSNFDGRSEKAVIQGWTADIRAGDNDRDIDWYRNDLRICKGGGGHWCGRWGHCYNGCGCLPCDADRLEATS